MRIECFSFTDQYWLGKCICKAGTTGTLCMESVDLCFPVNPCFMDGNCTSTPGVNNGFECSACQMEYSGDGYKCYGRKKYRSFPNFQLENITCDFTSML